MKIRKDIMFFIYLVAAFGWFVGWPILLIVWGFKGVALFFASFVCAFFGLCEVKKAINVWKELKEEEGAQQKYEKEKKGGCSKAGNWGIIVRV